MPDKVYRFKVELAGLGGSADEAWENAVEGFVQDAGTTPDPSEYTVEEEDDNTVTVVEGGILLPKEA